MEWRLSLVRLSVALTQLYRRLIMPTRTVVREMRALLLMLSLGLALVSTLICTTEPLLAHHSTAMYDMAMPTTVTGTVKRFEWTNPHAVIYLDVKDSNGKVEEWAIEMMSVSHLKSYGWVRDLVKPGDVISCT